MNIMDSLEELMESGNVNIFNFDEPMEGDIYGFVIQTGGCGCDEDCDGKTDPEPEYECPEVTYPEPIENFEFTAADDELCRQNAGFILDAYTQSYPGYVQNEQEVCDTLIEMLELQREEGISLSNNEEFLQYAASTPTFGGPELLPGLSIAVPDSVR